MSIVLNRTTLELLKSVSTPEYLTEDWVINPDLSGVVAVDKKFWKITGDVVSEMTNLEKDTAYLAENKLQKIEAIDLKTKDIILGGFSFGGKIFGLNPDSITDWIGTKQACDLGFLTYPFFISTINDEEFSLTDSTMVTNFYIAGLTAKVVAATGGRALKISVNDAANQTELDAVVDNR